MSSNLLDSFVFGGGRICGEFVACVEKRDYAWTGSSIGVNVRVAATWLKKSAPRPQLPCTASRALPWPSRIRCLGDFCFRAGSRADGVLHVG